MKEIVVISGKGGTGKTSLTASFAVLARQPVIADCDVDAADLHLVLAPNVIERHEFRAGREAFIRQEDCVGCGTCLEKCRFHAIEKKEGSERVSFFVDPLSCEGCGVCVRFCPAKCIDFDERMCGEWMVSETRCATMVHAQLGVAAENSGKLVSLVRREARRIAEEKKSPWILVDGPPGIGCPVIASVTGASCVLIVTEPTVSGEHDFQRVIALTKHFGIPTFLCINKWDINEEMTYHIEKKAVEFGACLAGRVRYDPSVTKAQMESRAVVETESPCKTDILDVWNQVSQVGDIDGTG